MSLGERLGNSASGAVAGFSTGLDLYAKYSEIKAQDDQRKRAQTISDGITSMVQNGEMTDPLEASKKIAALHLSAGDADGYMKYTQAAQGMQKVQQDKLGLQAYTQAQVDPYGAIDTLNKFNEIAGNGNKFTYEKTPQGIVVHSTGPQGQTSVDYTDPDHFKHDVMKYLEPWLMGPEKAMTVPAEVAKDQAQTEQATQAASASQALLPGQLGLQQAQIGASQASAANSASERAARSAELPSRLALTQAQIEASKAAASNAAADNTRADQELQLKKDAAPSEIKAREASAARDAAAAAGGDSVGEAVTKIIGRATPDIDGNIPPERDGAVVGPIARSIQNAAGGGGETNVSIAARLAGSNGLKIDVNAGKIQEPDGTVLSVGRDAAAILQRVMTAKAKAAAEAAQ